MFNKIELSMLQEKAETLPDLEQYGKRFTFIFNDGFRVSCRYSKGAALSLLKKLKKAKVRKTKLTAPRSASKRYDMSTYESFVFDGELSNAMEYTKLHNREMFFSGDCVLLKVTAIPNESRFFMAKVYSDGELSQWNVYHINSGMSCGCSSKNKNEVLIKFASITEEVLNQGDKDADHTKQTEMRASVK